MDLAELKFVVDTTQLKEAAKEVANLGTEVSKLNKPMQDLSSNTKKVSTATEKATKASENKAKADAKIVDNSSKLDGLLDKLTNRYTDMAKGSTSAEAGVLQLARSLGATTEESLKPYKDILESIRELSKSPFDSAIGSVRSITQEYDSLTYRSELAAKGIFLTNTQLKEYSKIASEIKGKLKAAGFDPTQGEGLVRFNSELKTQQDLYLGVANNVNTLKVAEKGRNDVLKAQIKAQNDSAKANEYIAKELERVNRLTASNGDLTSATNNRLIRFEKELRASGRTAAEVTTQLNAYKSALMATQKAAGNRQIDYLSRALGPQITDIAVGLATGQAPLTILLQQGGQLRDQFALAGVAGAEMGDMLVKATSSMVTSVKDVGVAIGSAFIGAVNNSGKAVVKFAMDVTGATNAIELMRYQIALFEKGSSGPIMKAFLVLGSAITFLTGTIIVAAIASLGALAKGFFDAVKEQNALAIQLTLTGASLGVNTASAIDYAKSLNSVGISTGSAIKVIQEMAKQGGFVASEMQMIIVAANNLKLANVPIEDTVKQFAKLKEKPVEALLEVAKATGMISPEITKLVYQLSEQGRTSDAAAVAMKAYADVTVKQKDRLKEEMSEFSLFMKTLSSSVGKFYDEVFVGLFRKTAPEEAIKRQIADVENRIRLGTQASPQTKAANEAALDALKEQLRLIKQATDAESTRRADQARTASLYEQFVKADASAASNEMKRDRELAEAKIRNDQLIAAGIITKTQAERQYQNIREKYKDPKPDKSLDYFEGVLLSIEKLTNRNTVSQSELNAAQLKMLELIADPRFAKEPEKKQAEALQRLANASAVIDEVAALELLRKQNLKVTEEYVKQQSDKDKIWFDQMQMSDEATRAVKQETDDIIFQASIIGMTDKERNKAIATRKIELDLIKEKLRIENDKSLTPEQKLELISEATDRAAQRTKNLDTAMQNAIGAEKMQMYGKAFEDVFKGMGDAMVDFALTGKTSFGDMVQSILVGLIRMQVQMQMMGMLQAMGGGKGLATSLMQFMGAPVPSAKGNVFDGGLQAFAKGGTFTNGIVSSPTMFNMGLMGEAGPEAIMPLRRGSDGSLGVAASGGGGGNVSVQVINNSNAQATTNESVDSKGNRKIEVVIGDMTAGEIARSGSASQKSIRSTFGVQPQLIRR